jgi:hypothetical protein
MTHYPEADYARRGRAGWLLRHGLSVRVLTRSSVTGKASM